MVSELVVTEAPNEVMGKGRGGNDDCACNFQIGSDGGGGGGGGGLYGERVCNGVHDGIDVETMTCG